MELEGTFMKVDVRNSNGHIYKAEAMQEAFEAYQKKVDAGEAYGILGDVTHPERSFSDNISNISHKITEIHWDASTGSIFGKVELLDTPNGKIAQEIVNNSGTLDMAPSMLVEPKEDGEYDVVQIRSFDICHESAWPDAKVKPVE